MTDLNAITKAAEDFATVVLREYPEAGSGGLGISVEIQGVSYGVTFGPLAMFPPTPTPIEELEAQFADPDEDPDETPPLGTDTPVSTSEAGDTPVSDVTDA